MSFCFSYISMLLSFLKRFTGCVWLVALARTKLVKENESEENPQDFPSTHKPSN